MLLHMVSKGSQSEILPTATVEIFMTTCANFVAIYFSGNSFVTLYVKSCAMSFIVHWSINNYI